MIKRAYDVLLCDADNTLFDFGAAEAAAFKKACEAMGIAYSDERLAVYSRINESLWKLFEQGGIEQKVLRVRRFELFLEAKGLKADAGKMCNAFMDNLGMQGILFDGALDAVRRWSEKMPVVIVTNGISRVQHGRMDHNPIRPYISGLVISEEVGAAKPDPRMIEEGMRLAGVTDKARVLMLGDSLSSDIGAANNAGVDSCWLNLNGAQSSGNVPVTYTVTALDQVDAILENGRKSV